MSHRSIGFWTAMTLTYAGIVQTGPAWAIYVSPYFQKSPLIGVEDYPLLSILHREEGIAFVILMLNQYGRVEDCNVVRSSGYPALDEATCRLAKRRGRFPIKLDPGGNPVTNDLIILRQVWKLPEDLPQPPRPAPPTK